MGDSIADGTNIKAKYGNIAFWSEELEKWIEPLQVYDSKKNRYTVNTKSFSKWKFWLYHPWSTPQDIRWKVVSLPSIKVGDVDRIKVENEIEFAFEVWEAETRHVDLTFTKVAPEKEADIIIRFGEVPWHRRIIDWIKDDGEAVAFTTSNQKEIIFNNNLSWDISDRVIGSLSIAEVAIHEIGHAIGLNHPCRCTEPPIMASKNR